jgi:CubicO group peptidase (beta-lactamase class C family)
VPLENSPGVKAKYSDIGYMVLCAVVEKVSGMRLDEFITKNVFEPLDISESISYLPIENNFYIDNIACTERLGNTRDGLVTFPNIREYTLQGEVHDEKAYYSMAGVSGHAGLFANAESINILNQVLLSGGTYNDKRIFSQEAVNAFTSVYDDSLYQLGFAHSINIRSLQDTVPFGTLSHTGWTGAFSLIDKQNNLSIVLLTNKRHSPIVDGDFEAASFDTGKYYPIVNAVYEALGLK